MTLELSILMCAIPTRIHSISQHLQAIQDQVEDNPVEFLCLYDNHTRSTGEKRNELLRMAQGAYVTMVDDDDRLSNDYVSSLLGVIRECSPDLITFNVELNRIERSGQRLSPLITKHRRRSDGKFETWGHDTGCIVDPSMHVQCWRSEIAKKYPYQDINRCEDVFWTRSVVDHVETWVNIDRVLYHYDWVMG